jgi:plastocyanin
MTRKIALTMLAAALIFGGVSTGSAQGLPTTAVMQFGNTGTGSPFSPVLQHDQSIHAADKMVPRTVTIAVGGTVTFVLSNPVHGAAVYEPGTEPSDINLGMAGLLAGCPPEPYVNDANGRLAQFAPICAGGTAANQFQFNEPGRYLVICTFEPHLALADMFGWVIVK